ncbi:MAG: hypothetical protein ACRDO1_15600 [Nocardioidaceae bacterium]
MSNYLSEEFEREKELQFLRSVHAAATAAYDLAAYGSPQEVYLVLARELRNRGIDPDPKAVFAAAHQISEGRQPPILRPGTGRRRRELPSTISPGSSASERLGLVRQLH